MQLSIMAKQKTKTSSEMLADIIIKGMQEKKAIDIVKLNLSGIPNSITDFFIICHGSSRSQAEAIAESVEFEVKKAIGEHVWHKEGYENAEWILLDYFDVVVHVFQPESRQFFQLEKLWADAERTDIEEVIVKEIKKENVRSKRK